ncbi:MAG TPA: hypothetical protein VH572_01690 [Gaiella sp.]|jgi:hypothetical protein
MTRRLVVLVGVMLVFAAMSVAGGAQPETFRKPTLRIGALYPLTINGSHFRARERVTVTVRTPAPHVKRVTATRTGTFRVTYAFTIPRCGTVTVRAVGGQGSRVTTQVPRPDCVEADAPAVAQP